MNKPVGNGGGGADVSNSSRCLGTSDVAAQQKTGQSG